MIVLTVIVVGGGLVVVVVEEVVEVVVVVVRLWRGSVIDTCVFKVTSIDVFISVAEEPQLTIYRGEYRTGFLWTCDAHSMHLYHGRS